MFFTVLVIVCHLGINPGCQKVVETERHRYTDMTTCTRATRALIEEMKTTDPYLFMTPLPPKPWDIRGYCMAPVIEETALG